MMKVGLAGLGYWGPNLARVLASNERCKFVACCDLDPEKVNVNGGAVALGHAIGQSGSRLLTTMLYEMKRRDAHRGIVSLCLGGGNAVAMAVER